MSMKAKYFQMKRKSKSKGEMFIYGGIVGDKWLESDVAATGFKNELDGLGDISEVNAHIDPSGGSAFEGHAICNILKMYPAKINIYVDALTASVAGIIAISGDTIFMYENSFLMVHNLWVTTMGNAEELRKTADLLERTDAINSSAYLGRAKDLDQEHLRQILDAEIWLTAEEALSFGLIDEILGANEIAASISRGQYKRSESVPEDSKKDVDKITKIDDVDTSELVETPRENMSLEEKEKREKIKRGCEILKTTMNY